MKVDKDIVFVIAGFALIFSLLYFLGSGGQTGGFNMVFIAIGLAAVGFILIFFATRLKVPGENSKNVTVKIDLPGKVGMDTNFLSIN